MGELDVLCRGAAIGIALLLGIAFWRARPNSSFAWVGWGYAAGNIGYLLWGDPVAPTWPAAVRAGVGVLALSPPFFFWALTRLVFEDGFRLRAGHWLWLGSIEVVGFAAFAPWGEAASRISYALGIGFRALSLALIAHALWLVWQGQRDDLIETRARLRRVVMIGAGVAAAVVLLVAILYTPVASRPAPLRLGEAAALLLMSLAIGVRLVGFDRDFLPSAAWTPPLLPAAISANGGAARAASVSSVVEADALARLDALIKQEEVWQEAGLTIGDLAGRVGIPEYRLRRLINQQLGFRNFTAFVNEYRLAAAASRLADRSQARTPVLTIALDLGWGSIGPFNRAFRSRFGVPPTEYRRQQTQPPPIDADCASAPEKSGRF
jgi:AraC-like DNA-binding protein